MPAAHMQEECVMLMTPTSHVPGACQVVLVRAGHLTDAHVIRLGRGQGTWPNTTWRPRRPSGQTWEVRHAWREVLDVFPDRDSLEAQFGQWQPACAQPGCGARLYDDGWHAYSLGTSATEAHEHKPRHRPGQLDAELAPLADQVWEDSESSVLIRVLIHELSDPGEIEDLFVVLNRNDLIEAQSLPAPGRATAWSSGPASEFAAGVLDNLIMAAGELWDSTGGHDPHDVLSSPQREALD